MRTFTRETQAKVIQQYPRQLPWVKVGLLIIISFLLVRCVGYNYQQVKPRSKVILLVANFDGPEPQKHLATEKVLVHLRQALEQYDDVRVEVLGRIITEEEGSAVARVEGVKREAAIVIWGWYEVMPDAVLLNARFEVLRPPEYLPKVGVPSKVSVERMAVAELRSFTLQTCLSEEMAYLSLFTAGMARYVAADWDEAVTHFNSALDQTAECSVPDLDQSAVYFYRGLATYAKGDYNRAVADFDQVIHLRSDLAAAYINRGSAYGERGEHDRAIADFNQAIKLQPDSAVAYYDRGFIYSKEDDYDRAVTDFDQAIKLRPDSSAVAYYHRGLVYGKKSDYDRAIADLNKAIQLQPNLAMAYYNRGFLYYEKGDYDHAIADFDQVIELQPDSGDAYNNRGFIYGEKGDYDRAIADLNKAIQLQADQVAAYYNRAYVYTQQGEKEKAIADFKKVLELSNEPHVRRQAQEQLKALGEGD